MDWKSKGVSLSCKEIETSIDERHDGKGNKIIYIHRSCRFVSEEWVIRLKLNEIMEELKISILRYGT